MTETMNGKNGQKADSDPFATIELPKSSKMDPNQGFMKPNFLMFQ